MVTSVFRLPTQAPPTHRTTSIDRVPSLPAAAARTFDTKRRSTVGSHAGDLGNKVAWAVSVVQTTIQERDQQEQFDKLLVLGLIDVCLIHLNSLGVVWPRFAFGNRQSSYSYIFFAFS